MVSWGWFWTAPSSGLRPLSVLPGKMRATLTQPKLRRHLLDRLGSHAARPQNEASDWLCRSLADLGRGRWREGKIGIQLP